MPKELRPSEVVWGYWDQLLVIEEDAMRCAVEYVDMAEGGELCPQ